MVCNNNKQRIYSRSSNSSTYHDFYSKYVVVDILAYLEHISSFSILLAYDRLERPVAPLSGASRPARGPDNDCQVPLSVLKGT